MQALLTHQANRSPTRRADRVEVAVRPLVQMQPGPDKEPVKLITLTHDVDPRPSGRVAPAVRDEATLRPFGLQ